MVGYYISTGDEEVGSKFIPYVFGDNGLGKLIKEHISNKDYGDDLKLLLIQYYVEGKFSRYLPEEPKLGNYKKKDRNIAIAIGVPCRLFHSRNEFERREFVVDSTLNAVNVVREKLEKKKLDINFDSLLSDLKEISKKFLETQGSYSKI